MALARGAAAFLVAELDLILAAAIEQHPLHALVELAPRGLDIEFVVARQRLQHLKVMRVAPVPAAHGAAGERQMRVHHHALGVEEFLKAQTVAGWAGAGRVVEREHARLERRHREAALGTGVAAGEQHRHELRVFREHHAYDSLTEPDRGLERLGQPLARLRPHAETIHHRLDGVLALGIECRYGVDLVYHIVDAHPHEALAGKFAEQLGVLAAAIVDQRRQQQCKLPGWRLQHLIDHLAHGLRRQIDAVVRATRYPGPRVQQPQIVVDLGDGADGGARVVRAGLLLDGNRRRQAFDAVDVGFVHDRQKLARIRRQRLDVAALAFRIKSVKCQRRLARTRQTRDHDQPLARQVEIDVAQVVGTGTADADGLQRGS